METIKTILEILGIVTILIVAITLREYIYDFSRGRTNKNYFKWLIGKDNE